MTGKKIEPLFPPPSGLSATDLDAVRLFVSDLDRAAAGLAALAFDYVVSGHDDDIPRRVQEAYAARRHTVISSAADLDALKHLLVWLEGWDAPAVKRLGELIEPTSRARQASARGSCPDFFRALIERWASARPYPWEAPDDIGRTFTGSRCLELLALGDADQAALVEVLFSDVRNDARRNAQLAMPGLAEILGAAPDRTLAGARVLDLSGRCAFIKFLAHSGLVRETAFFDFLFETIGYDRKWEREAALLALKSCGDAEVRERAVELLRSGTTDGRRAGIAVLAELGTPVARSLIEAHAPHETSRIVRQAIAEAIGPLRVVEQDMLVGVTDGYAGIDGDWIEVPLVEAPPPESSLPADFAAQLAKAAVTTNEIAARHLEAWHIKYADSTPLQRRILNIPDTFEPPYPEAAIAEFIDIVAGKVPPHLASAGARALSGGLPTPYVAVRRDYTMRLEELLSRPDIAPQHVTRIAALALAAERRWADYLLGMRDAGPAPFLLSRRAIAGGDFRPILALCASVGYGAGDFLADFLGAHWGRAAMEAIAGDRSVLWQVVVEHLGLVDQALGLAPPPPGTWFQSLRGLELLAVLPTPPRRYLPTLIDLAVGGARDLRDVASALLLKTKSAIDFILPILDGDNEARRIGAAHWLARRRDPTAIPALREALARETTDAGRAALLRALVRLGDDVTDQFSEARVIAEAEKGLKKVRTKAGSCVPLDHLPALTWADGRPVPDDLVRWWVVLADRMKNPGGNGLLDLALDRLDQDSAERLGWFVLFSFIAHCTIHMDGKAEAYADENLAAMLAEYRTWLPSVDHTHARGLLRHKFFTRHQKAAAERRGVLALAHRARTSEAVRMIEHFFRAHHWMREQCRALIDLLAHNGSPAALAFVARAARSDRTAGTRKHAARLLDAIIEERGWTPDDLADCIAATGGLDETGVIKLPLGRDVCTASLDARAAIVIRDRHGKLLKKLPQGEVQERMDADLALAALRRTAGQVVREQTRRLYDAMCAGRLWRTTDLAAHLLGHPIISRLCRRLVFAGLDAQGGIVATFRLSDDGAIVTARGERLDLDGFAAVRLAHRAVLDERSLSAWQSVIEASPIVPPFDQLTRPLRRAGDLTSTSPDIRDREGHVLERAALLKAATALGYRQEDDDMFAVLRKSFPMAETDALIEFVGGQLANSAVPCALGGLRFVRGGEPLPPPAVPPILLSEAWNDYHAIAAAGAGFDPDWQAKVRW